MKRMLHGSGKLIYLTDRTMKRILSVIALCLLAFGAWAKVTDYTLRVLQKYPHDSKAYTQGLFFYNGTMYESTGLKGQSSVRIVDYKTGKVTKKVAMPSFCFGEGSCIIDDKMFVLTWQNSLAFEYDPVNLNCNRKMAYQREGWGLAAIPEDVHSRYSGAVMVASDGSSRLFFLDKNLRTKKTINVTFNGRSLSLLNELEWIDGKIWANVYTSDIIVIINPSTGVVEGRIDCSSLIPQNNRTASMDVLNGIAYLPSSQGNRGGIFLTGKKWPWLFRVELVRR